ncbi:unnamed protein product, partial [Amoebophrya sp. A25]|eukprot:GSA25T00014489001.1
MAVVENNVVQNRCILDNIVTKRFTRKQITISNTILGSRVSVAQAKAQKTPFASMAEMCKGAIVYENGLPFVIHDFLQPAAEYTLFLYLDGQQETGTGTLIRLDLSLLPANKLQGPVIVFENKARMIAATNN